MFLRSGDESLMELERRKWIVSEYENASLPDWLHDEVVVIQRMLEYEITE